MNEIFRIGKNKGKIEYFKVWGEQNGGTLIRVRQNFIFALFLLDTPHFVVFFCQFYVGFCVYRCDLWQRNGFRQGRRTSLPEIILNFMLLACIISKIKNFLLTLELMMLLGEIYFK